MKQRKNKYNFIDTTVDGIYEKIRHNLSDTTVGDSQLKYM